MIYYLLLGLMLSPLLFTVHYEGDRNLTEGFSSYSDGGQPLNTTSNTLFFEKLNHDLQPH